MNKEEKAKLWSDRIQQYQTSGQTCKQWCTENGIPLSTMGYWIRRFAKEEPASESEQDMVFVRLPSEQEAARKLLSEESSSVRIFISDSIRIEISDSVSYTHLWYLLSAIYGLTILKLLVESKKETKKFNFYSIAIIFFCVFMHFATDYLVNINTTNNVVMTVSLLLEKTIGSCLLYTSRCV